MNDVEIMRLKGKLDKVFMEYLMKCPQDRPLDIPNYKCVFVKEDDVYDVGQYVPLMDFTEEQIRRLVAEERLERPTYLDDSAELLDWALRMRARDQGRYQLHADRLRLHADRLQLHADRLHLEEHNADFCMGAPVSGLPDSIELIDMLEYLADAVSYHHTCHFEAPNGRKNIPPCVASSQRWHSSPPGDFLTCPIIRRRCPPLHGNIPFMPSVLKSGYHLAKPNGRFTLPLPLPDGWAAGLFLF